MKTYLNKLKNLSVYKLLLNNYFLIAFFSLLTLISIRNIICIIFLIIYSFYLYKESKQIFKLATIITTFILIHSIYLDITYDFLQLNEVSGEVIEISEVESGIKLTIKNKYHKYIVYDYNLDVSLNYGDVVFVQGKALSSEVNRVKNGFNYQKYLKQKRIFACVIAEKIEVVKHKFNLGIVKSKFEEYIESFFSYDSYVFLKAMIIGDLDLVSDDFKEAIMDNGILHLFAVSGLHIALFIGLIEKVLKFFQIEEKKIEYTNSIFLILYLIITSFSPSVLRAALMYYISLLNKNFKLGFSTLDIISIIFILLISYNPLYYYDLGFNLSFISATTIILVGNFFSKYNKYLQVLIISFFANIITFPLVININSKINILSPVSNVIFIELVEVVILPISFFILIFPIFSKLYDFLIISFNKIAFLFSKVFVINLKFPYINSFASIMYYLVLYFIMKVYKIKKYRYLLIFLLSSSLIIFSNSAYLVPKTEIHFLDLANGEASLIIDSRSQCYALIDTGDGKNKEVTSYLKRQGIKRLNYLILTHNHADHNGEANNILKEIKADNVVVSFIDPSIKNGYINITDNTNVLYVSANDKLVCGKIEFLILHPDKDYLDTNDDSIIIYLEIGGLNFLFLGDATKIVEEKIAEINLDVDVIKIAHHGSSTSTSKKLIAKLQPKYAIIMAGRVEKFAFPHIETIQTLNEYNIKIYRTDLDYSIIFKANKRKYSFTTLN